MNELKIHIPWRLRRAIKKGKIPKFFEDVPPYKEVPCYGIAGTYTRFATRQQHQKKFKDTHSAYIYARKKARSIDFWNKDEDVGVYWKVIIL